MEEIKTLTAKEVFDQIVALQKQITENSNHSLHRLGDSFTSVFENNPDLTGEVITDAVQSITTVFLERENTLRRMLMFYEKMYDDLVKALSE
ncbi:MAG: hypothetical protein IJX47_04760 [Clostridia bacterium]|nr:hypothetical protein [Clostridia bacterium]